MVSLHPVIALNSPSAFIKKDRRKESRQNVCGVREPVIGSAPATWQRVGVD